LVDGEVALEQAPVRAEELDARLDVGPPEIAELARRRGPRRGAVVVRGQPHHHAAELHAYVLAFRQLRDAGPPRLEDLVTLAGVRPVPERSANVADDDVRVGTRTRELDRVGHLRMERPRIQAEPERGELAEPRAKVGLPHQVRALRRPAVADDVAGVPRCRMPHAAEASAARADVRLQNWLDPIAQREIGEAHDPRSNPCTPVPAPAA